ncbi:orotate phosphoribosyltransferase [Peniophora sp. CONT]|nr:orotate phosphoribosyltransferase [Peniophora sp. CONT]
MASSLAPYQLELIQGAMSVDALKFGSFTLKSGRISPYFINVGLISTGPLLTSLCSAYASSIAASLAEKKLPEFDVLFGPAYKGIPLAAITSVLLHKEHGIDTGFAYDRKEAKDHGEGGMLVGVPIKGKRVLILDDVMTAGTAVRNALAMVRGAGGEVVGVIQCLDREEVGKDGVSTVKELEKELGGPGRVSAILQMRDLMQWVRENGRTEELKAMEAYREQYGVKE